MKEFKILSNEYLSVDIRAFYREAYLGYKRLGNPDYLNVLKNTYNKEAKDILLSAENDLRKALIEDLPQVLESLKLQNITACVVPRAKVRYYVNQWLFKSTVQFVVGQLMGFSDGTNYIRRRTNTKTTHLKNNTPNYINDGSEPYPGITTQTCDISDKVMGKNILLIDDIYTATVNIDEDAIQALINSGAKSVAFYAVGKTEGRN